MTITTTITAASADLLGLGGVDARTGGLIMSGPAAQHEGTGLPIAAGTCVEPAAGVVDGRPRVATDLDRRPKSLRTAERFPAFTYLSQNDDTTLGIRSPGRPMS